MRRGVLLHSCVGALAKVAQGTPKGSRGCLREACGRGTQPTLTEAQHSTVFACPVCPSLVARLCPLPQPAPVGTEVRSSNAYMLLYRQKGWGEPPAPAAAEQLPPGTRARVQAAAAAWRAEVLRYQGQRERILERVEQRRQVRWRGWAAWAKCGQEVGKREIPERKGLSLIIKPHLQAVRQVLEQAPGQVMHPLPASS